MSQRTTVVTGANRGIGHELARQLIAAGDSVILTAGDSVILTARDAEKAQAAITELPDTSGEIVAHQLDVTDPESATALARFIDERFGRLDVLINNAAIHYDTFQHAHDADLRIIREALETNLIGAWQVTQALLPLLRASRHGRIVNVSSEGGSLTNMGAGIPAYRVSKTALNALTRLLAAELSSAHILVNSVCPGWVATDMGGPGGRPVADGAASIMWAVDLPDNGPTGGFYRDGRPLPW